MLEWTSQYFQEQGFDQPRLDAEVLLAEAMQCKRIELYTRFDEEPDAQAKTVFRDWVARHVEGEPVAYLAGHREFFSLNFDVDPSVLIPRPETEHLVTEALDVIKTCSHQPCRIVDVGTGSGCVAISIAKHCDDSQIVACDISQAALQLATRNAEKHEVGSRIQFIESDLLGNVSQPDQFDLIVSNPPYIGTDEKSDLPKSVIDYEPHEALFSEGAKGTETIERLLKQAATRLSDDGWLMFEISPMIAGLCQQLVEAESNLRFDRIVNDLAGLKRIVVAQKSAEPSSV